QRREKIAQRFADADVPASRRAYIGRRFDRATADADFLVTEKLGWRGGVVLAWSGMRGAITLAAAQSLPSDTPYRAELILIAFVVAMTTLLLQGLTLPTVIRLVKIPADDQERLRTEYGTLLAELADAGEKELAGSSSGADPQTVERVRADSLIGVRDERGSSSPDPDHDERREQYI